MVIIPILIPPALKNYLRAFFEHIVAFFREESEPNPPYPLSTWDELSKEDWPAGYTKAKESFDTEEDKGEPEVLPGGAWSVLLLLPLL